MSLSALQSAPRGLPFDSPRQRLSGHHKLIKWYLSCLTAIYFFLVLVPSVEGADDPRLKYALVAVYGFLGIYAVVIGPKYWEKIIVWVGLFAGCALCNLLSTDRVLEAMAQWALVFAQMFILARIVGSMGVLELRSVLKLAAFLLSAYLAGGLWICRGEIGQYSYRWQTLSFYAGLLLFLALLFRPVPRTCLMVWACIVLYVSGSRGAVLAAAVGMFYLIFSRAFLRRRQALTMILGTVLVMGLMAGLVSKVVDKFAAVKISNDISLADSLQRTAEGRFLLWRMTYDIVSAKPLGLGLGQRYVLASESMMFTAHNGYLASVLEGGMQTLLVSLIFLAFYWWKLRFVSRADQRLGAVIKAFTLFYLTRSFYENYLLFNFANLVTNIFWICIIFTLTRSDSGRSVLHDPRSRALL